MKKVVAFVFVFVFAVCVMMTVASPAVGVTPTLIGRGTFDPFYVKASGPAAGSPLTPDPFESIGGGVWIGDGWVPKGHPLAALADTSGDDNVGGVEFEAKTKSPLDIVVRTHDYAAGGSTGWHTHPGPVFITVLQGTVTFYEYDDPTCTPTIVSAGQGYVDSGRGHYARNETGAPAKDVSVIIAPVGLPFRGELPAPGPNCAF